jgi:putative FmdB family regulatory protein
MPLYDYKCTQCGNVAEVRHGFNEGHDAPCPACGGILARVFNPAPIVFKGSGFYVTDSRKSRGGTGSAAASPETPSAADATPKADAPPKTDTPAAAKEPTKKTTGTDTKSVTTTKEPAA